MKSIFKFTKYFSTISRTMPNSGVFRQSKYLTSYSFHLQNYCSTFTKNNVPRNNFTNETKSGSEESIENESTSSSSEEEQEAEAEAQLRLKILEASLPFVHLHGWSSDSLSKGAESLGYSNMLHGMFPKGDVELVNYFYKKCNDKLERELQQKVQSQKQVESGPRSTTAFLHDAIELRLRMNVEYIDTWAKALVIHASPSNLPIAFENVGNIVDTIWYYAGDRSVDSTWYTRRGSLLLIYKSTELCLLQDDSEDFKNTWDFLSRRLQEVESVEHFVNLTCNRLGNAGTLARVGLTTVQNMLGLNSRWK